MADSTPHQVEEKRSSVVEETNFHQLTDKNDLGALEANSHHSSSDDDDSTINEDPQNELAQVPTNNSTVARTLSAVRTRESGKDIGPPPDGGLQAWLQVALGHMIIFNTWGYINSFGVFQTYYTSTLGRSPSDISWVGSIQIFLLFFIGTFSGRATDAGYFRFTLTVGATLECFSIFMTSLCTEYWQLFLAQGLGQGIGCGLMFCPTLALISTYFVRRRGIALGLAASGSATGGLVFPAVVMKLLPQIGYGWTMRVLGLISVVTLIPCVLFFKQRLPPRKSGPIVEWAAFKEPSYLLFAIGMFLNFWGLYVAFFYIGSFSRNVIGVDQTTSIDLLMVMNGVGIWCDGSGGLLLGCREGYVGVMGIRGVLWSVRCGYPIAFPATLSTLTTDMKKTGVRMGMVLSVVAIAALIGSPIAGALVQLDNGGYLYAQMFMGSAIIAGTLTLIAARIVKVGTGIARV
ncbi:hypothetical protein N7481_012688 [Penicillium waksmanii]|uniref:uncharacterized protein n=1 Tax=Penicillium waksmanii TaxID=69791 RepID=UPI002546696A|nr:uncharacterized protein N7481_012688 [Penicillium waksmanii]KAJ5965974.1 hypothetical protein N7481_012688 [Penicillium waksmanii]